MAETKISANEVYMKDLFDHKYLFEIPNFQRPFSWEKDNFTQLSDDIKEAIEDNEEKYGFQIDNYEPYFLGSIILRTKNLKGDGSGIYEIIDGQQRIISFTIFLAVIRDLIKPETKIDKNRQSKLQNRIYQEEDDDAGDIAEMRVKIRSKESQFFQKYILEIDGTKKIDELSKNDLSKPKENICDAIEIFKGIFCDDSNDVNNNLLNTYIKFILQKVVLVVIVTDTLNSAFRLFNITNTRGVPLTNADLLKSENLGQIKETEINKYTEIWENIEVDIGLEKLDMLISFIRSIKLKEKAKISIYKEFEKKVFNKDPGFKGKNFIEYLEKVASIYKKYILDGDISSSNVDNNTYYYNLITLMRDYLPFNDWMAALIKFVEKFNDDSNLYRFLIKLEKKVVFDWVKGLTFTPRLTQIYRIIRLIEKNNEIENILEDKIFNDEIFADKQSFKNSINDSKLYNKARSRISKYLLLRIDMEKYYNTNKKIRYTGIITVEHILPQTPKDKYWLDRFDKMEKLDWTNRLGNLVLLNHRKNSQASNKPFPLKKQDYFEKRSDFRITQDLKRYNDWDMKNLKERHKFLMVKASNIWIS